MAKAKRSQPAPRVRLFTDKEQAQRVWEVRESALGATSHVSEPISWEGWEDAAVPPEKLGVYLRASANCKPNLAIAAPCMDTLGMPASTCDKFRFRNERRGE